MSRPGKPSGLVTRAETKAKKAERAQKEDTLRPKRGLPNDAPGQLKDYPVARATWRAAMREYNDLEREIVTRLDMAHLVDYCMLAQHLSEIEYMRKAAYQAWLELANEYDRLAELEKADEAVIMATKVVGAFDAVTKLDTRAERKRALIKQWRESLYLTPRARAGTVPPTKEKEVPPDDMEQLMDDVTNFVNEPK
jgi:phage terminase small subunit